MGGFENWSETIGGILHNAGIKDFLGNLGTFRDEVDEEANQWASFLQALYELIADAEIAAAEIAAAKIADAAGVTDAKATDPKVKGFTAKQIAEKVRDYGSPFSTDDTQQLLLPDLLAEEKERRPDSFTRILGNALKSKEETRFLLREGNNKFDIYIKPHDIKKNNAIVWTVVKEPTS
jgi:hypothetical protein